MKEKNCAGVKEVIFGAWKVSIWKVDGTYQGEVILTTLPKGVDVPSIMRDGFPFTVGTKGLEGENVKYIFPPLIPRILAALKG